MMNGRAPLSADDLSTLRDIRNDLQREGERNGKPFVQRGLVVLDKLLDAGVAVSRNEDQLCLQSHYAAIVEAHKDTEIYQRGDADCSSCLHRMAEKHEALVEVFRSKLAAIGGAP